MASYTFDGRGLRVKYLYRNAVVSDDRWLLSEINDAAERLAIKLSNVDLSALGVSEYNQHYVASKRHNLTACLQLYSHLLALCLDGTRIPRTDYRLVDYGGGSGIFSLLAKEFGIGCVIYNDIYDVSCSDVERISQAINLDINVIVCGDVDSLLKELRSRSLAVNGICSFDVIEHIYDIEGFLRKFPLMPSSSLRIVFGSGANSRNPVIRRYLQKKQFISEHYDRPREFGHKERDTLLSFLKARRNIVAEYCPELNPDEIERIALGTRGLRKADIEACVDEYRARGVVTYKPTSDTNTCDPFTGNWEEHLMDPAWLKDVLEDAGFTVRILSGYWGHAAARHKRLIKGVLNRAIHYCGAQGLMFAPYYVVHGDLKERPGDVASAQGR